MSRLRARARPAEAGMTLVEVLVVLAIIAIATGITVLALGSDEGLRAQAVARKLQVRIQAASDRALVSDAPLAIGVAPGGYRVLGWNPGTGGYAPIPGDPLGEPVELPTSMALSATGTAPVAGMGAGIGAGAGSATVLPIDADGIGQPFVLTLTADDRRFAVSFDGITARLVPVPAA